MIKSIRYELSTDTYIISYDSYKTRTCKSISNLPNTVKAFIDNPSTKTTTKDGFTYYTR